MRLLAATYGKDVFVSFQTGTSAYVVRGTLVHAVRPTSTSAYQDRASGRVLATVSSWSMTIVVPVGTVGQVVTVRPG